MVVRVGLLPLDRMGHTAGAIAGGDLSHRVESTDPRTEVGRLGISLNAMLDRLERAFGEREASEDRLRRFIADASHELRTPLASIRGYAELFRMGAAREPGRRREGDAAHRGRGRAHGRAGRGPADARAPGRGGRRAARAARPRRARPRRRRRRARRGARAGEIGVEVDGPALVVGDRDQLRQVLGNLLRNAFVHTPRGHADRGEPARTATARCASRSATTGPGLPTSDAEALFERFWRSEGGRERGRGGAGLGLAIVAAIVDAHDGDVRAGNAPGRRRDLRRHAPAAPRGRTSVSPF